MWGAKVMVSSATGWNVVGSAGAVTLWFPRHGDAVAMMETLNQAPGVTYMVERALNPHGECELCD